MKYGKIPRPEEQARVEVVVDPLSITRQLFSLWQKKRARGLYDGEGYRAELADDLYKHAIALIDPVKDAYKNIKPAQLEDITNHLSADYSCATGLFLSALHNTAPFQTLDGSFQHLIAGYRLAKSKILILRTGSCCHYAGCMSEGVVLNYAAGLGNWLGTFIHRQCRDGEGKTPTFFLGGEAKGGVVANFADNSRLTIGMSAENGIRLNYGTAEDMGEFATGGVQINLETIDCFANDTAGYLINFGNVGRVSNYAGNPATEIDASKSELCWSNKQHNFASLPEPAQRLVQRLRKTACKLQVFKSLPEDNIADNAEKFNWAAFEQEVNTLAAQIKEAVDAK